MAAVVQQSALVASLAKKLGAQLTQANEKHKDTPVDLGNQGLPGGIRAGKAQLTKAYFSVKKDGNDKGKEFFRASAMVKFPKTHNGQKIYGRITSYMINLYPEPAIGKREARSFDDNWGEFLNFLKSVGIQPTSEKDPMKIALYYDAVLKELEKVKPMIEFSTREYTPPATREKPKPEARVYESWHGITEYVEEGDAQADGMAAPPTDAEPSANGAMKAEPFNEFETPADVPAADETPADPADEIAALIEAANADPKSETDDGKAAKIRLEELAIEAGATAEMVNAADNWEEVGAMALGQMPEEAAKAQADPAKGGVYSFRKRKANGEPLTDKSGAEFAPMEIEVLTVDVAKKTVTAKSTKDGKTVVGIDKKPTAIKWEWLE